jgi:4-amino-4-deoxy-L-arabinose transferase-like glycosyltransferase
MVWTLRAAQRRVLGGRFARGLLVTTMLGLAVRLVYLLAFRRDRGLVGDPFFYHHGAELLVDGKGFIAPLQYKFFGITIEAADHPPLYMLFLTIPSAVGLGSVFAHKLWSTLLGTATVTLTGLVGRRVGGDRVGLIAAGIAAFSPNTWVFDAMVLSETMAIFMSTLALLAAYRAWEQPSVGRIAALGVVCGLAALSRSELALLVPALLWPIAARAGEIPGGARLQRAALGTVAAVVVVAPWTLYNLTRFEHPVLLSSQFGATVAGANCDDTYYGENVGLFTAKCLTYQHPPDEDESVTEQALRKNVREYVDEHLSRVPVVVAARLGRIVGVFRPGQQMRIDEFIETREHNVVVAELFTGYVVGIGAIAGAIILRRRRGPPVFPLVVLPAIVLFTVAITYASARFRASCETALAILTAVAVDALWRRLRPERRQRSAVVERLPSVGE